MSSSTNFGSFFKEDALEIQEVIKGVDAPKATLDFSSDAITPKTKSGPAAEEAELKKAWKKLRYFFRNGNNTTSLKGLTPLLYAKYHDEEIRGTDYPMWIANEEVTSEFNVRPLARLLEDAMAEIAVESKASILRNNIPRLVKMADAVIAQDMKPHNFYSCVTTVLDELVGKLNISGDDSNEFKKQVRALKKKVPAGGLLVPYSPNAPFQIAGAAIQNELGAARQRLTARIESVKNTLKGLIAIEAEKGNQDPKKLSSSLSFASSLMDFDRISQVLPELGTEEMPTTRMDRIKKAVSDLEATDKLLKNIAHVFVCDDQFTQTSPDWKVLLGNVGIKKFKSGAGYESAVKEFEKEMALWCNVFGAMQIGELEISNTYSEEVHEEYFNHLSWRDLSEEDISSCPPFILIANSETIIDKELGSFSSMLSKGIPIKSLIVRSRSDEDYKGNGAYSQQEFSHRQELGAMVISHRNAYVCQSTAVMPEKLYSEFTQGLAAAMPSVFCLLSYNSSSAADSFKWVNAAVSGREFPGFTYEGDLNKKWGSRFSINNNAQPQNEWPEFEVEIKNSDSKSESMTARFTFADFASMDGKYSTLFSEIQQEHWTDDLIEISNYLHLEKSEAIGKVPFIWMVNEQSELVKVAVAWPLVLMCKERHEFWQFLQSSSGINSIHVEQALEKEKDSLEEKAQEEISALEEQHKKELDSAVDEATNNAMDNLSAVLMDMDTNVVLSGIGGGSTAPSSKMSSPELGTDVNAHAEVEEAKEEDAGLSMTAEAYIETPLCTTCNECTNLNDSMFKYNGDKMAFIADISAGTFAELVEAAELCPVRIIHPGDPINPGEAGLEDLVKRAAEFN